MPNYTQERSRDAHLPFLAMYVVMSLKPVTNGQSDARPAVTFPAAERRRPLTGAKSHCALTRDNLSRV